MNKPTPGPWTFGPCPGQVEGPGGELLAGGIDFRISDYTKNVNTALIVAAVNACFKVNPDNPMAVAEALPELVAELREADRVVCRLCKRLNPQHQDCETCEDRAYRQEALAKLEAKP